MNGYTKQQMKFEPVMSAYQLFVICLFFKDALTYIEGFSSTQDVQRRKM